MTRQQKLFRNPPVRPDQSEELVRTNPDKRAVPAMALGAENLPARPDQLKQLVRTRNSLTTKTSKSRPDQPQELVRMTTEKNDRFLAKQLNTSKLKLRFLGTQKRLKTVTKHI